MKAIILAVDDEWGIGLNGKLPWHNPDDLKQFKLITNNSVCIMGYNTYAEIAERTNYLRNNLLLSNRLCLIVTQQNITESENVKKMDNFRAAIKYAENSIYENIFFIGGKGIFSEAMNHIDNMFISYIRGNYECDIHFDPFDHIDMGSTDISSEEILSTDDLNIVKYNLRKRG